MFLQSSLCIVQVFVFERDVDIVEKFRQDSVGDNVTETDCVLVVEYLSSCTDECLENIL